MVRRSFRIGLRLGLLVGAALALVKTVQSRRPTTKDAAPPAPWEPLQDAADEPIVDEVGEPVMEPAAPEDEPEPEPGIDAGAMRLERPGTTPSDVGAPAGTPPEAELLGTGVEPAGDVDPGLDIVSEEGAPVRPTHRPAKATPAAKTAAPATAGKAAAKKAAPAKKAAAKKAAPATKAAAEEATPWVDPEGGICPPTHPVKAKLKSRLFHLPGMFAYDRTNPDRCYADADAAVTEGFTSAKR